MIRSRKNVMILTRDEKGQNWMGKLMLEVAKSGPAHFIRGSLIGIVLRLSLATSGNVLEVLVLTKFTVSSNDILLL